jgi:hypothetical protein
MSCRTESEPSTGVEPATPAWKACVSPWTPRRHGCCVGVPVPNRPPAPRHARPHGDTRRRLGLSMPSTVEFSTHNTTGMPGWCRGDRSRTCNRWFWRSELFLLSYAPDKKCRPVRDPGGRYTRHTECATCATCPGKTIRQGKWAARSRARPANRAARAAAVCGFATDSRIVPLDRSSFCQPPYGGFPGMATNLSDHRVPGRRVTPSRAAGPNAEPRGGTRGGTQRGAARRVQSVGWRGSVVIVVVGNGGLAARPVPLVRLST